MRLILALACLSLAACDDFPKKVDNGCGQAQAEAQTKIAEMQVNQQKMFNQLQLKVVEACVNKGNIPIFQNGNVDCKVAK
jgi:outer membrane PBP1 activator LpoA protein